MRGIYMGHPQPRSRVGEKTLRRCRNNYNNEGYDNVVLIDVDTNDFDNIVVIDVPESLPKKTRHSSNYRNDKKLSFTNVIHIDDDDDDEINTNDGVTKDFPDTPVRLSKCKRTYSGMASGINRFGLDSSSESDSSSDNNDYPDCELMEDVTGEVQELWEKAFSRRRKKFQVNHSDTKNSPEWEHVETDEIGPLSGKSSFSKGFLGTILRDTHLNEAKLHQKEDKDGQVNGEDGGTSASEETCMISEREKLKETDEYKRAMEDEWASRQQALQIQAEEAKNQRRLQKRMKAESMRLLDMERRQKQRIEEVRDIQRKEEENMNLKESIRVEVRTELKGVEALCHSMASLLHSLGISVGGWPTPMPQEVQTAYKRALLTFHPDRASQSDIRQQVEAEEKFKLINRLKEKFSPL